MPRPGKAQVLPRARRRQVRQKLAPELAPKLVQGQPRAQPLDSPRCGPRIPGTSRGPRRGTAVQLLCRIRSIGSSLSRPRINQIRANPLTIHCLARAVRHEFRRRSLIRRGNWEEKYPRRSILSTNSPVRTVPIHSRAAPAGSPGSAAICRRKPIPEESAPVRWSIAPAAPPTGRSSVRVRPQ